MIEIAIYIAAAAIALAAAVWAIADIWSGRSKDE